jgi:hypothetical protein
MKQAIKRSDDVNDFEVNEDERSVPFGNVHQPDGGWWARRSAALAARKEAQ